MLNREDNELLYRVGAGTPMGDLIRQFWIPCLLSSELPDPDGAPQRVMLLGEKLIAFRDTDGKVGLVQDNCPHRGASMFFGRNEESGLRCVYHGWKFDASGACVDMPNEPPESNFKHKVRITAYPCVERNGLIWTYMGPRQTAPALPDIEPNMTSPDRIQYQKAMRECNWVQALEGDIDTSHLGILHLGGVEAESLTPGGFDYYTVKDRAPRYEVMDTDFGTMYAAYRPAEEDSYYWRFANFLFPFYTQIPTGTLGQVQRVRAWVPMDDTHTMFWSMAVPDSLQGQGGSRLRATGEPVPGTTAGFSYEAPSSGWYGQWRLAANASNDYMIDREAQRNGNFTGINGIHLQDQAVTESMGPIYDRTRERLGTSDVMIIRTRRRLIQAATALLERGEVPAGVDHPAVYQQRSGSIILKRDQHWLRATEDLRKAFVTHTGL